MLNFITKIIDYLSTSVPPGPKVLKLKNVVNFQKGGTFFYTLMLMEYFKNYNITSYIYLALHGTYGMIWLIKDKIMPDSNWERKITIPSAILSFILVLGPYWMFPYYTVKNKIDADHFTIFSAISLHTLGIVLMMASDSQKYFTLQIKRKLINNGWFAKIRNTNYLGEMMIYFSYALLSRRKESFLILAYVWSLLFIPNMLNKDKRILKKDGGQEYIKKSNMLIPFKL